MYMEIELPSPNEVQKELGVKTSVVLVQRVVAPLGATSLFSVLIHSLLDSEAFFVFLLYFYFFA